MASTDVNFVSNYDWQGLYINGVLVDEGHSLNVPDVLRHLERRHAINLKTLEADEDWLQECGSFPMEFHKVKLNK